MLYSKNQKKFENKLNKKTSCCKISVAFCYYLFIYFNFFSLFFVYACFTKSCGLFVFVFLCYLIKNEVNITKHKKKKQQGFFAQPHNNFSLLINTFKLQKDLLLFDDSTESIKPVCFADNYFPESWVSRNVADFYFCKDSELYFGFQRLKNSENKRFIHINLVGVRCYSFKTLKTLRFVNEFHMHILHIFILLKEQYNIFELFLFAKICNWQNTYLYGR